MRPSTTILRSSRMAVAFITAAAIGLPGCTTQTSRIGANDGSDACYANRVTLDSTGNYFGEDIAKGALIGAGAGALAGGLAAAISGRNVATYAAVGAVAGAAVGAAGGYWSAKRQQEQDQAKLWQTVYTDIGRENAEIDKTQLAFNQLVDCRRNEANQIRADLAAGRIDRPEAERRMIGVRARMAKDVEIARTINKQVQERSANFQFAAEQINPVPYRAIARAPLRSEARADGATVDSLNAGQTYYASRENNDWVRVSLPGDRVAYAPSSALVPSADSASIASAEQAPSQQRSRVRGRAPQQSASAPRVRDANVAQVASTNLAKREQLSQSIEVASASNSAFELAPAS